LDDRGTASDSSVAATVSLNGGAWGHVLQAFLYAKISFDFAKEFAYNKRMLVDIKTSCNGQGYWSGRPLKRIRIHELRVPTSGHDFGELTAWFSKDDWDIDEHGLIYTDHGWLRTFRWGLRKYGFSWDAIRNIDYSEQGMQGETYVSKDVGKPFLDEYVLLTRKERS